MEVNGGTERLACGRDVARLIEQVADGSTASDPSHRASCPHCRSTLVELTRLWGEVRELAREDIEVPDRIVRKVSERVRRERSARTTAVPLEDVVPRLVRHALLESGRGRTKVAEPLIATLVRRVALSNTGVYAIGRTVTSAVLPVALAPRGVTIEVTGERLTVDISLVVEFGVSAPALVESVRRRVIESVEETTGLHVVAVNVSVVDVHAEDG